MADHQDYPPVALGRLDDRSGWHWLSPRPVGVADWTLCACMVVLALPVLAVFGPAVWIIRACQGKYGDGRSSANNIRDAIDGLPDALRRYRGKVRAA